MIKISQHEIPCARVKFKTPLLLLLLYTYTYSLLLKIVSYRMYRDGRRSFHLHFRVKLFICFEERWAVCTWI